VSAPQISVVVPTRNRPGDALACAEALLACTGPSFELIFVDQSDAAATREALAALGDARLRCLATPGKGASAGRNAGIAEARAPLLAFTDDDCRPPADWLARIAAFFAAEPDAGLLCGRVRVPEGLEGDQFGASFDAGVPEVLPDLRDGMVSFGLSANMAVTRAALERLGPFDEALSPGTDLRAGEDFDWVVRAARSGLRVRNEPAIEVLHLGIRRGPEVRALRLGYILATGACFFKHVRAGDPHVRRLFLAELRRATAEVAAAALQNRRPLGLHWLLGFVRGALQSYRYRVDGERKLFVGWRDRAPVRALRVPAVR
jgi:glycosyltransferase involved in cell wall biosynthesis